jgi:hypothetical protein
MGGDRNSTEKRDGTSARRTRAGGKRPAEQGSELAADRRRRSWRALAGGADQEPAPAPGEEDEVIDGLVFDYRGETRCRVCAAADPDKQLPNGERVRADIDRLLVEGWTYADIEGRIRAHVEDWPESCRPSRSSIRRHQLRHLRADQVAVRSIIERRALEQGLRIAAGSGPIITLAGVLEVVRQRGLQAVAEGQVVPSVRETVEAARLLDDLDQQAGNRLSPSEIGLQVRTFLEVVRERLPERDWDDVMAEVELRLSGGLDEPEPPQLPAATVKDGADG